MDVDELLEAAILAPSSHNTQPWIFQVQTQAIRLLADRTRALPVNDPLDRELTISCGCALFNLRVAAAARKIGTAISRLPEPANPDLLAEVMLTRNAEEPEEIGCLADVLSRRRTYRKRFDECEVSEPILDELSRAARTEAAKLHVVADETARAEIAQLVSEGDSIQWSDPSWRRELAQWMHPRRKGDGLTVPGLVAPIAQAVVRTFDMGKGIAAKDRDLADASPVIAVLGTDSDTPGNWLAAGEALARVLLTACRHGLQASYLNQAVQVSSLRSKLRDLVAPESFPQVVIRLGYPSEEIAAAPRRDLQQVLEAL